MKIDNRSGSTISRLALTLLLLGSFISAPSFAQKNKETPQSTLSVEAKNLLQGISGDSMRGHLSFLASDLLEGRGTPSRGLDLAAEYIAAQFRIAGLEAVGDDGYFQTADWTQIKPPARRNPNAPASATQEAEAAPTGPVKVRNVIGVLRGSDPVLRDSYVLVTAHYDHLGIQGGKIFNGANDNGSGTVTVIELAKAFAAMKVKPKRSIVFMTFFGEEKGLVGSRYYGKNPIFPLSKTVAGINLEQVGRTDDSEGVQIAAANITGFDFSEVGEAIVQAGVATDIKVWKHPVNSDRFFGQSDNQVLADQGVPAHTISVAYGFPDYHAANDDWEKVDYANMEKVDRAIALAVLNIANNPIAPKWNANNPKAAKYLKAWENQQKAK
jgi:hypothetical protein